MIITTLPMLSTQTGIAVLADCSCAHYPCYYLCKRVTLVINQQEDAGAYPVDRQQLIQNSANISSYTIVQTSTRTEYRKHQLCPQADLTVPATVST